MMSEDSPQTAFWELMALVSVVSPDNHVIPPSSANYTETTFRVRYSIHGFESEALD